MITPPRCERNCEGRAMLQGCTFSSCNFVIREALLPFLGPIAVPFSSAGPEVWVEPCVADRNVPSGLSYLGLWGCLRVCSGLV